MRITFFDACWCPPISAGHVSVSETSLYTIQSGLFWAFRDGVGRAAFDALNL